jgi:NAD(P)-dependent dehydrogenase (short-subunit alcohol dehydrogenase family)
VSVQTAVVVGVGSSAGLGAALARRFAKEGLRVIVAGRTSARVTTVASEIRDAGGSAEAVVADATREADVVSLLNEVGQKETLDLVAYNVGNNAMIPTLEISEAQFETMWRQNACAACCRMDAAPFSIPAPLRPCVHGLLLLLLPQPRLPCAP